MDTRPACTNESVVEAADSHGEPCAAVDESLAAGDAATAWQRIAPLLLQTPVPRRIYQSGAKALIAAALDGSLTPSRRSRELDDCWRAMILQPDGDDATTAEQRPPALAEQLEAGASSGSHEALNQVAALIGPTLRDIFKSNQANKQAVLLLLLTRGSQAGWIGAGELRALHLQWFARFNRSDLELPYNFLFVVGGHPSANRDDIRALASRPERLVAIDGEHSLMHLLFVELLTGARLFSSATQLVDVIVARRTGWDSSDDSLRAGRSLVARYRPAQNDSGAAARLAAVGCNVDLEEVGSDRRPGSVPAERPLFGARWIHERSWQAVQAARSVVETRFPFLALGRRRLRVAVCVSGQLRGYRQALASWRRALLPMVDATVFVHSWRAVGRSGAHPSRYLLPFQGAAFQAQYRQACTSIGYEEVGNRYPVLFRMLAESADVDAATVAAAYGTDHVQLDDEREMPFARMNNQQKMHGKIEACHSLALASGEPFDLVIRTRPDKSIRLVGFDWAGLAQICRTRPTLFADHPMGTLYANLAIGDQFAVGAIEPMTVYSRTWSLYPALARNRLFKCGQDFTGHCSIAQVCWAYRIGVERIPIRFGALQEAEPMATTLILESLMADAQGRMDAVDRSLIDAAAADAHRG